MTRADAIVAELAAAEAQLAAFARTAAGQVRLAVLRSSNATLVPDALADLAARGLDITVSLVEAGPDQAFALLLRAECDLAVTFDHPTLPDHRLREPRGPPARCRAGPGRRHRSQTDHRRSARQPTAHRAAVSALLDALQKAASRAGDTDRQTR